MWWCVPPGLFKTGNTRLRPFFMEIIIHQDSFCSKVIPGEIFTKTKTAVAIDLRQWSLSPSRSTIRGYNSRVMSCAHHAAVCTTDWQVFNVWPPGCTPWIRRLRFALNNQRLQYPRDELRSSRGSVHCRLANAQPAQRLIWRRVTPGLSKTGNTRLCGKATSSAKTMQWIRKIHITYFVENFMQVIIHRDTFSLKWVPGEIFTKNKHSSCYWPAPMIVEPFVLNNQRL